MSEGYGAVASEQRADLPELTHYETLVEAITKLTNVQTRSRKSAKEDIQKRIKKCIQFFEQQKNLAPLSLGCD